MGNNNLIMYGVIGLVILMALGVINLNTMSFNLPSATGAVAGSGSSCATVTPIETLQLQDVTKYSNSYTADSSGSIKFFASGVNVQDANANPIDTQAFTTGNASDTHKALFTCTPYHVIYDGAGTYYGVDIGTVTFDMNAYNPTRGIASMSPVTVATVGAFSDPLDETAVTGIINGQTNVNNSGTNEIDTAGVNANPLVYDISVGDASWYVDVTVSCTGANTECQNMVLVPVFEASAEPEGTEYTSIAVQHISGTTVTMPSEIVNYWKNQQAISSGTLTGGQSGVYRFTFTVAESNLDANDDWAMYLDDLGSRLGKDIGNDVGATAVKVDFDAQA